MIYKVPVSPFLHGRLQMSLPDTDTTIIKVNDLPGPDFTIYLARGHETDEGGSTYSQEESFNITHGKTEESGRGLKCLAYRGNYWSLTLRCEAKNSRRTPETDYSKRLENGLLQYAQKHGIDRFKLQSFLGYCPAGYE